MRASTNALDLIKKFEKCCLEAYEDQGGVWTVGWGTTGPGIREHLFITQKTADAMLIGDVSRLGIDITPLVGINVNQNQFDALVSLTYNIGLQAFKDSTLLKLIQSHKLEAASEEFDKWIHVHGTVSDGLKARREAEKKLFLTQI